MAATVNIYRITGSSVTSDITSINTRAQTNDTHTTAGTTHPIPVPSVGATNIASSTNATPIVVSCAAAHGLSNGDMVRIEGHTTNTNANGTWKIANIAATTMELTNRAGNGVGGATGTVTKVNCSYWVVTALYATVAPSGTINNVRWYLDGTSGFGTGVVMKVGTGNTYVTASGTSGTTGDAMSPVSGGYGSTLTIASAVNATPYAFTYTSGSPLSVAGSLTATTGKISDYVAYQIEVASTASPGATPAETVTWIFDET